MSTVEFAPDIEKAQRKIEEAYPNLSERQISYLAGYLSCAADKQEEEDQKKERA